MEPGLILYPSPLLSRRNIENLYFMKIIRKYFIKLLTAYRHNVYCLRQACKSLTIKWRNRLFYQKQIYLDRCVKSDILDIINKGVTL
ncbi:hypothetical protein SAMN02746065_105102 [Desulfocicer vacuolatum DSM 3385]|uniref:Uncharacterized protein n=1 Tax=Desulfocicer vacuolatum DSM 3385 TaxID=1121400 RepID=A0A1W2AJ62_9BACT|nr:hypothetical protein SAMN02746065_105102 [Desulfocicer vacuolatum DSM 3385]